MKKRMKWLAAGIAVLMLFAAGYVGLAVYYQDEFAANTWINGVYCTGRTVEEVNSLLLDRTNVPAKFTVVGYDSVGSLAQETEWVLDLDEIRLTLDYGEKLRDCLAGQNSWMWLADLAFSRKYELSADVRIDEEALRDWCGRITAASDGDPDYRIVFRGQEGYVLYDGLHNRLDSAMAYEAIRDAILAGEDGVSLIERECYYDEKLTAAQKREEQFWQKIEDFQARGPVYDFGEGAQPLSRAQMCEFLVKDENTQRPVVDEAGHFVLEKDCAAQWVKEMAELHDTYGKEWSFRSARGEDLTVKGGTYGTSINQKRETLWLSEYLDGLIAGPEEAGQDRDGADPAAEEDAEYEDVPGVEIHIPYYTRDAYNRSGEGIGSTYIEVDMGVQKLYYYEKGVLRLETDVVTGNARRRMSTPEGVNYVYSKQKNRILRGEGYASPVKYWMPVKGAIGLHDATWRDEFGGDIYKTNGSHGCINLPLEAMEKLYGMVEVGTPVVMFYGEDPQAPAG